MTATLTAATATVTAHARPMTDDERTNLTAPYTDGGFTYDVAHDIVVDGHHVVTVFEGTSARSGLVNLDGSTSYMYTYAVPDLAEVFEGRRESGQYGCLVLAARGWIMRQYHRRLIDRDVMNACCRAATASLPGPRPQRPLKSSNPARDEAITKVLRRRSIARARDRYGDRSW